MRGLTYGAFGKDDCGLKARGYPQVTQYLADVNIDRAFADVQRFGNFRRGVALIDQSQDIALA